MDESLIRGLVIGGAFAALGIAASFIWQLMRSPSERARRTRQVAAAGFVLLLIVGFIAGSPKDREVLMWIAAITGAGFWIFRA